MERFNKFIDIVFENEGYISNDKADKGGLTKYGISKKAYPNVDILNLTKEDAKQIYLNDYYDPCRIALIKNELLALHVFDMAVNAGVSRASKMLQKVARVTVDGKIGSKTLAATNNQNLANVFIDMRKDFYKDIAACGGNAKFLKGWLRRVDNTTNKLIK